MKKILMLATLILVVLIAIYRQRIFLRDPLATVMRDGVKVNGVTASINFSNDVLLDDRSAGRHRLYLVQNWNKLAGTPAVALTCVQGLACFTDADHASATAIVPNSHGRRPASTGVTMTSREVDFVDEDGSPVQVKLR